MATFTDAVVKVVGKKALAHIDQDALAIKLYPILEKGIISSVQDSMKGGYLSESIQDLLSDLCDTKEFKTALLNLLVKGVNSGNS